MAVPASSAVSAPSRIPSPLQAQQAALEEDQFEEFELEGVLYSFNS